MKHAIIYLHGFNSAALDHSGKLLTSKNKLAVLERFCNDLQIKFCVSNIDYRDFEKILAHFIQLHRELIDQDYNVVFMGSSLGGFSSEYLALKTKSKAILINPAINPSDQLVKYIGITENFETKSPFDWHQANCDQFKRYEIELKKFTTEKGRRTILLDMADELIDSSQTYRQYKEIADVTIYKGGSHSFEHIEEALPIIKKAVIHG